MCNNIGCKIIIIDTTMQTFYAEIIFKNLNLCIILYGLW